MGKKMDRDAAIASLKADYIDITLGQDVSVRGFLPEDAPGIGRLFLQTYGESYPVDDPYVPELLIEANRQRTTVTAVAVTPDGSVVGQGAVFNSSAPNRRMYEYGQIVVDKAYRKKSARRHSAITQLNQYIGETIIGRTECIAAVYAEAVCHHIVSQKMGQSIRMIECGLELGLMPEVAYQGENVKGRASNILILRINDGGSGPLYIPECWRSAFALLMQPFAPDRRVSVVDAEMPWDAEETAFEVSHFAFAGVMRVNVARIGRDFASVVARAVSEAQEQAYAVIQVFMNLGQTSVGPAAEILKRAGFFPAAALPLWFGDTAPGPDALLAQRFLAPVELEAMRFRTDRGRCVAECVVAEMRRAAREEGAPLATLRDETKDRTSG
jgi:hypothetical protein